jgi:preprotein translocase subunit SecF
MTAGTVFVAVLALALWGGPVLYSFSIAMLWGVIVGTYSSIWIACAALVYMKFRPEQLRRDADDKDEKEAKAGA